MKLDIRIPIGLLFAILGCLLTVQGLLIVCGLVSGGRSLDWNVNLWWGLILLGFGTIMFLAGRRQRPAEQPTETSETQPH